MSDIKPLPRKKPKVVLDSRHLKVLGAKKTELEDGLVLVVLDEDKYGHLDKGQLRKLIQSMEVIAPDSAWYGMMKNYSIEIYDRADFKNKDLLVTIKHDEEDVDPDRIEEEFRQALFGASSVEFIHGSSATINIGVPGNPNTTAVNFFPVRPPSTTPMTPPPSTTPMTPPRQRRRAKQYGNKNKP